MRTWGLGSRQSRNPGIRLQEEAETIFGFYAGAGSYDISKDLGLDLSREKKEGGKRRLDFCVPRLEHALAWRCCMKREKGTRTRPYVTEIENKREREREKYCSGDRPRK